MKRVVIIGGGPIGIEAALYGAVAGCDVQLFERGEIASNVRSWGYVHVFTEWARNRSPLAARLLRERGATLPPEESNSTGDELAEYAASLAALPELEGRVHTHTQVLAISRERTLRSDLIDDPRRLERPFRILVRGPQGEQIVHADAVIDASGVYTTPNYVGNGGMPCPGESDLMERIDYAIPDVAGRDRARFENKTTLVVGSGHSAASTLIAVGDLLDSAPATRIVWAVRRDVPEHGDPYTLIPEDESSTRNKLHTRANALAHDERVDFHPRTIVDSIARESTPQGERLRVTLLTTTPQGQQATQVLVDNIAAHTGFRPDNTLYAELTVQIHAATGAPLRLGEALVAANHSKGLGLSTGYAEKPAKKEEPGNIEQLDEKVVDKWKFSPNDPDLLETGEKNFFVLGIKSYGRDAGFLMQNGFRQVRDAYKLIQSCALDLYEGALD
jgi:thioredoxin reductase